MIAIENMCPKIKKIGLKIFLFYFILYVIDHSFCKIQKVYYFKAQVEQLFPHNRLFLDHNRVDFNSPNGNIEKKILFLLILSSKDHYSDIIM